MAPSVRTSSRLPFARKAALAAALGFTFVSFAGAGSAAFAQLQSINGSIRGTVTDPSGAPIPGATVTVKNLNTGFVRQVVTSGDGSYLALNLPIGTYSVNSTASGFSPLTQTGITLEAGSAATVDEHLTVGSVATEVQVTSDAPIIEVARTDLGRTITAEETENLPLTSRNPYNFILFQPGVSGHPNTENGVPGVLNTNGLVDRVNYQLDGEVDTETDRYGLRLFAISDSYVDQIQTISNSFSPEFGNTAGIIYNVLTGSGTNKVHGEIQYIWRPKAASSCPILKTCDPTVPSGIVKPSLHVDDLLGRLSGPVLHDKLFVFGAYEHLKRSTPQTNTLSASTQSALIAAGVSPSDFGTAGQVQRAQWVDVRVDYTINRKNQAFVRYNYFRNNYPFNTNVGATYLLSAASDFQDRAHDIGAQLLTTFTPRLLNEFRASWPYRNEQHFPDAVTGKGPAISIASPAAIFGGPAVNGSGDKYQEKIPSFNDNLTLIKGAHSLKFGVGFQKNLDTQLSQTYTQYNFATIQQYIDAKNGVGGGTVYSSLQASIGRPGAAYHSIFFDFFAQDTWQIRKNLIANYGVRYDQYRAPTPPAGEPFPFSQNFNTPKANFAPRVGIAYSPLPTTVIRLNGGIFYEPVATNTWYLPLYANGAAGTGSFLATVVGNTACSPSFPNSPQTLPASCLSAVPDITTLNPAFKNEYTWNGNLQVAQQLAKNDALTLSYVITNGRNMQFLRNINPIPSGVFLADGRPIYGSGRNYPAYGNVTLIDSGSNSSYNALTATYEHRMSAGLTTSASYTWSHSISNTPEGNTYQFSTIVEDASKPFRDRSNSSINRPNSFTISTVYNPKVRLDNRILNAFANGNTLAVLGNFSSGDPLIETVSPKLNGDPLASSRPLFVGRNTIVTPPIAQVDARYTRAFFTFRDRYNARVLVESTNLLNRTNVTGMNTTATVQPCIVTTTGPNPSICSNALAPGTSGFLAGQITAAPSLARSAGLDARILQFGLKIDF